MERYLGVADQYSKNVEEVVTYIQRKRPAVSGGMVYFTRDEGGATSGAWVGHFLANDFAYAGLRQGMRT